MTPSSHTAHAKGLGDVGPLPGEGGVLTLTLEVHLLALGEHPAAPDAERAQRVVVLLARLWGQSKGPAGRSRCRGCGQACCRQGVHRARLGECPVLCASWLCPLGTTSGHRGLVMPLASAAPAQQSKGIPSTPLPARRQRASGHLRTRAPGGGGMGRGKAGIISQGEGELGAGEGLGS